MYRATARTYIKKTRKLMAEGRFDEAEVAAKEAYSTLDKAARKRIIHPRNASRRKGRLMAALSVARSAADE
jgi:small subunit ribosomal protein S20